MKNTNVTKIENIILNAGVCTDNRANRTVMSETGLPAGTEVLFVEDRSRSRGTGYKDSIFRILGTEDALILHHCAGPVDNLDWADIEVRKDFFKDRRSFGQRVGRLTRKYHLPFEVGLALGDDEEVYKTFLAEVAAFSYLVREDEVVGADIYAGISRRKSALRKILGEDLCERLNLYRMGQENTSRLARYIISRAK